jgi:predicted metal-dependent peptidase
MNTELKKIKTATIAARTAKPAEELSKQEVFDLAEENLRKARFLARSVFPYLARPLTAMSIKITEKAVYPTPKEYVDDKGNTVTVPRAKFCAGERTDASGKEFWLMPTFGVDEKMRTFIHPLAVDMWIAEASAVSTTTPCQTCGKTHHHPLAYVAGVFCHELWHPVRKHHKRAKTYGSTFNPKVWNAAADCEINDNIQDYSKSTNLDRLCLPATGCFPEKFELERDLLAEEYYSLLMKKQECKDKGGKGKGKNEGEGMPEGGRCGSGCDGQKSEFEEGAGEGASEVEKDEGVGEGELEAMSRKVAQDILEAAAKNPGSVPAGLSRWAGELLGPPKYNWRKELTSLIRYCSSRYTAGHKISTYSRLSRVSTVNDFSVILPTQKKPVPNVAAVVDTSGSVSQKALEIALTEVEGLCKLLRTPINVISVDTTAVGKKVKRIKDAVIQGGGGTDMRLGINKALADREKPSLIIVFTDGFTPHPEDAPKNTKIIYCLCGDRHSVCTDESIPSWAYIVRVEPEDEK